MVIINFYIFKLLRYMYECSIRVQVLVLCMYMYTYSTYTMYHLPLTHIIAGIVWCLISFMAFWPLSLP